MSASPRQQALGSTKRGRKALQVGAVVVLVAAASVGGAFYHWRFGDKEIKDDGRILSATKRILKVDVPKRLWPRLLVERPDVSSMVVYATKDEEACLAIIGCLPEWSRERGHRADRLLQEALHQYAPQFETERLTDVEARAVSAQGASQQAKIGTSFRADDHREVRVVTLGNLTTERGAVSLYFQTSVDTFTEDEINALLKSLE